MVNRRITEDLASAMRPIPNNLWDRPIDLPVKADSVAEVSSTKSVASKALFESRYVDTQASYGKTAEAPQAPQRPQIEPPSIQTVLNKQKMVGELNDLFEEIKNVDSDQKILRLIFERIQMQREHRNVSSVHTHHRINMEQAHQKRAQEEEFNIHKVLDEAIRTRITTDTLSTIFTVLNIGLLAGAIAAAVVTGGAAIAGAISAIQALSSLGNGINTGFATHYKSESDLQKALLEGVKHKRDTSHATVQGDLKHNAENEKNYAILAKMQSEMQNEAYENTRMAGPESS